MSSGNSIIQHHRLFTVAFFDVFAFDEYESYVDQAYLITHVVFTLNNWGELALEPELLPHEHLFIRENLGVAVRGSAS